MTDASTAFFHDPRAEADPTKRRVSPLIAALLTLLFGWGMGHFYARRTRTAILITAGAVGAHVLFCLGMYWLSTRGLLPPPHPYSFDWIDLSVMRVAVPIETIPFAVWAWMSASRLPLVERAGPVRLLGYLALWAAPLAFLAVIGAFAPWEGGWSGRLQDGRFVFD